MNELHVPLHCFIAEHGRLPRLGDDPAPYTYQGWLLRYVALAHAVIPEMNDRWDYHQRQMQAGRLLDEPIPQISFLQAPDPATYKALERWVTIAEQHGRLWDGLQRFIDWLAYGLGVADTPPQLDEAVQIRLYKEVQIHLFLQHPYDYFGDFIASRKSSGFNPFAFFPTPHPIVELMTRIQMDDPSSSQPIDRTRTSEKLRTREKIMDPCCGTGRMLLHASNISLRLYGADIDPLVALIAKINGALYVPWLAYPFPDSWFTTPENQDHQVDTTPNALEPALVHAHTIQASTQIEFAFD